MTHDTTPQPLTAEELSIFKAHCTHIGKTNVITHADGTEITLRRLLATIDAQAATIADRDAEIKRLRGVLEEFENHPCTATCERNRTGCIFCNAREALKGG